jgi:hypothetical protein
MAKRDPIPTDTEMLDWIAQFITEVEAYTNNSIRLTYYPIQTDCRTIFRSGKSENDAFRKCVRAAMHITRRLWLEELRRKKRKRRAAKTSAKN